MKFSRLTESSVEIVKKFTKITTDKPKTTYVAESKKVAVEEVKTELLSDNVEFIDMMKLAGLSK